MDLHKETPYGRITISERVFGEMMLDLLSGDEFKDRVWAATKKGRIIYEDAVFAENDAVSTIKIERDEDDRILLNFSVVVKFGVSIEKITDRLADILSQLIEKHDGKGPGRITIEITGVKGRVLARRNMEVVKEYEY